MIPKYISQIKIQEYLQHDYYQKISKYLNNKKVLDVGCVDENILLANTRRLWNFWFIYKTAKNVYGIDIERKSIQKMEKMGFQVLTMSAEEINFNNKFDVIFAGELIEHLSNPGLFLQKSKKALKRGGKIVLSTPNTFGINKIVRVIQLWTNEPPENPDHTMYFTPRNLEALAKKCGLKIIKIDYAHFPFTNQSAMSFLNKIVCKILGEKFKEQIIAVLQ
jgi:2-polyprenyl-3-methyl-5-hydroxy-6-metoxy-1,4-benzoquinol methylase